MTPRAKRRLVLALAAVASCLPLFLFDVGGDILFHYGLIECFVREFWQGNIYPRWCMDADAGMGSPVFLFYFPFGYWVASLLYPLTWAGLTIPQLHIAACVLASLAAAVTSYRWLRGSVGAWPAVVGAILYLYVPYRMEVMLYRSAYAELWGMALLPLVLAGWRDVVATKPHAMIRLAVAQAWLALAHAPLMLIAGLGGVIYVLVASVQRGRAFLHYAQAGILSLALTAFYFVPAKFYQPDVAVAQDLDQWADWANRFLSAANVTEYHQERLVAIIVTMIVAALALTIRCLLKRERISSDPVRREVMAWTAILAFALWMLLPASALVWQLLAFAKSVAFPWRMQALIAAALVYFAAIHAGHLRSERGQKTARGDTIGLMCLLALMSFFLLSMRDKEADPVMRRVIELQMVMASEYRTRWTEPEFAPALENRERLHALAEEPRAEVISGSALVTVSEWGAGRITLKVRAFGDSEVRLRQRYFPLWSAYDRKTRLAVELRPQAKSGWIEFSVPKGEYELRLKASPALADRRMAAVYGISALFWLLVLGWRGQKNCAMRKVF